MCQNEKHVFVPFSYLKYANKKCCGLVGYNADGRHLPSDADVLALFSSVFPPFLFSLCSDTPAASVNGAVAAVISVRLL